MKESLAISQSQQLGQRLSPRQVQYARLLEMTAPEIEEEVRRQLDDNPALEVVEPAELESTQASETEVLEAPEHDIDDDPADYMKPSAAPESRSWQIADDTSSLYDSLVQQVRQLTLPDLATKAAYYIIGNLDENGYLTRSLGAMADDIAIATGVEISPEDMRMAFDAVRQLDPAGVGAIDLRDCLLLQLDRREPKTLDLRIAREIVADNFDLLSKKHFDRLQAQLGLDDREQLRTALKLIRTLNPKPGSGLELSASTQRIGQITPDVVVEDLGEGRMSVSLASRLPQLQVERTFAIDAFGGKPATKGEREAQAFVKLKRDDAETFISALRQRGNTLLAVTEAIVKRQPEFFQTGDQARLRPMILKDISSDTGLDLSAISRATAGKYVTTELGTYPLKMFFNEAPSEESDTSSHQLLDALRRIIENEDKHHPLSDQAILAAMQAQGYNLARRTVTKYREKLGLPVGRLRKVE